MLLKALLVELTLDLTTEPQSLCALFRIPVEEVRLEIGFGGGEYLLSQARAHPRIGFIGIEPFVNGMAKALSVIAADLLANVRVHAGEASGNGAGLGCRRHRWRALISLSGPLAQAPPLETPFLNLPTSPR